MSALVLLATKEISDLGVVLLGLGTVFVGLIAIILLCTITGAIFASKKIEKNEDEPINSPVAATDSIPNKQEFIAAVSAAIAEDMGTDVSAIRIKSIEKV